jgi:hypothetical protein
MENCLRSERSPSLHLSIRRLIKKDCRNCRGILHCQLHIKCYQHPAIKVTSICRGNYWGSSVRILTQVNYYHVFCIRHILKKKMGIQWTNVSAIIHSRKQMIQLGGMSCIIFSMSLVSQWNWQGKHLSDIFLLEMLWNKMLSHPCFSTFPYSMPMGGFR